MSWNTNEKNIKSLHPPDPDHSKNDEVPAYSCFCGDHIFGYYFLFIYFFNFHLILDISVFEIVL